MNNKIKFDHPAFSHLPDEEYWRLIIDGTQQTDPTERGWQKYDEREAGSVRSLLNAFSYMLKTIDKEPLSETLIQEFHRLIFEINPSKVMTSEYIKRDCNNYNVINVCRDNGYTPEGLAMLQERAKKGEFGIEEGSDRKDGKGKRPRITPHQDQISKTINHIIQEYNQKLKKIQKEILDMPAARAAKLLNIVICIQELELLHPFTDGNGRIFCIVTLNKLLLENGFSPVILEDPNRFDCFTPEQLVVEIEAGMGRFQKLVEMRPTTEEIIQDQLRFAYFSAPITPPEQDRIQGKDPIHWAIAAGLPDLARKMLQMAKKVGIDLNAKNVEGKTVLMLAAASGDLELVKILLSHAVDVTIKDSLGNTAATWAAAAGHKAITDLLAIQTVSTTLSERKADDASTDDLLLVLSKLFPTLPTPETSIALTSDQVSRKDARLLDKIRGIIDPTFKDWWGYRRPDPDDTSRKTGEFDLSHLLNLHFMLLQCDCLIACKFQLLEAVKQRIAKADIANMSYECEHEITDSFLEPFKDLPNYQQLQQFARKAKILFKYKDELNRGVRLLVMAEELTQDGTFSSKEAAIQYVCQIPKLAEILLLPKGTYWLNRDHFFVKSFLDNPKYSKELLALMLSNSKVVSSLNRKTFCQISLFFEFVCKDGLELQKQLHEAVLNNEKSKKNCLGDNNIDKILADYKEQARLQVNKEQEDRGFRTSEIEINSIIVLAIQKKQTSNRVKKYLQNGEQPTNKNSLQPPPESKVSPLSSLDSNPLPQNSPQVKNAANPDAVITVANAAESKATPDRCEYKASTPVPASAPPALKEATPSDKKESTTTPLDLANDFLKKIEEATKSQIVRDIIKQACLPENQRLLDNKHPSKWRLIRYTWKRLPIPAILSDLIVVAKCKILELYQKNNDVLSTEDYHFLQSNRHGTSFGRTTSVSLFAKLKRNGTRASQQILERRQHHSDAIKRRHHG